MGNSIDALADDERVEFYRTLSLEALGCALAASNPDQKIAYLEIARRLAPVVKSILYGEACSNVPIYKRK